MSDSISGGARILVVDDTSSNLQLVGGIISKNIECELAFAMDGQGALAAVREAAPDLILLDVMMPGMSGFDVCRELKGSPETAGIPIIFLTAKTDSANVVAGFGLGAVDYLAKPFIPQELVARVKTQLQLKRAIDLSHRREMESRQLLHVLCHDLANPIGGIRNMLREINDFAEWSETRDDLIQAAENAVNVIKLVRQMRAIDEGKYRMELVAAPLSPLVEAASASVRRAFLDKEVTMSTSIPADIEVKIEPFSFVNSVVCNLLTNALKFSARGAEVAIAAASRGEWVELSVVDQGIGMSDALQANLFDTGKPTSRPGTEGEVGTGFGMPLVKKYVEAYGGEIEIRSRNAETCPDGHGTTVSVRLRPA